MKTKLFVILGLVAMACLGCGDGEVPEPNIPPTPDPDGYARVSLSVSEVDYMGGEVVVNIESDRVGLEWAARITEGDEWCSFDEKKQVVLATGAISDESSQLTFYVARSKETTARNATIRFAFKGEAAEELVLTQTREEFDYPTGDGIPNFGSWAEVPQYVDQANYEYVSYFAPLLDGTDFRNFSICFDRDKKAALWVAYPYHAIYVGDEDRADDWHYDPLIDREFQVNCIDGSYHASDWDRGHQIASKDRTATYEMNYQTFTMTNITPQQSYLNRYKWKYLEQKIRANVCADTLYVVTGAYFGDGYDIVEDDVYDDAPRPTHYYKVMLSTKSGNSGKAIADCAPSELKAIGFWLANEKPANNSVDASFAFSVDEIEQKTGLNFFPQVAEEVEAQCNYGDWK